MLWTISLAMIGLGFGGILKKTGCLKPYISIVPQGRMFRQLYEEKNLHTKKLIRGS